MIHTASGFTTYMTAYGNPFYPDVPIDRARSRHEFARNLLAHGLDPSALNAALGKHIFAATMREWEIARGHKSHFDALKDILGALPIAVADEMVS